MIFQLTASWRFTIGYSWLYQWWIPFISIEWSTLQWVPHKFWHFGTLYICDNYVVRRVVLRVTPRITREKNSKRAFSVYNPNRWSNSNGCGWGTFTTITEISEHKMSLNFSTNKEYHANTWCSKLTDFFGVSEGHLAGNKYETIIFLNIISLL